MKNKLSLIILIVVMLLSACGFSNPPVDSSAVKQSKSEVEAEKKSITLEACVQNIPHIFRGECVSVTMHENGWEKIVEIRPDEFYQGGLEGSSITLVTMDSFFQAGNSYIVFASRNDSVYTQRITNVVEYAVSYSDGTIQGDKIVGMEGLQEDAFIQRIRDLVKENGYHGPEVINGSYIKSDKLEDVVQEAEYVLEVKLKGYQFPPTAKDRVWATCTVSAVLKGIAAEGEEIQAVLPAEGLSVDADYILLLTKYGQEKSLVYFIVAPQSVFPADSQEAEIIRTLCSEEIQ